MYIRTKVTSHEQVSTLVLKQQIQGTGKQESIIKKVFAFIMR